MIAHYPLIVVTLFTSLIISPLLNADNTELGGKNNITAPLPEKLLGKFPFDEPQYNGIEQILVLSDRWVIVINNTMHELYERINELSDGELGVAVKNWLASKDNIRPNWSAYHARWKIRDKYIAKARGQITESQLMKATSFYIHSDEDENYHIPKNPSRADRLFVSAGQDRKHGGVFRIDYNNYSYLEMPTPMQDGAEYQIKSTLNNNSVTFKFDRKKTISRAIKVNQLGYLPNAKQKRAYLGAYLYRFGPLDLKHVKTFEVINAQTGEVALTGDVELLEKNPRFYPKNKAQNPQERPFMYGEDVYLLDFSALKEEGIFFISVPGVGRSWPFRHSDDSYGDVFYTAIRGLYHQRAGMPVEKKYSPWVRPKVRRGPFCESEHVFFPKHTGGPTKYKRFDVIGATINCDNSRVEIPGGWHDAADWDSNAEHYTVIFDLLNAYSFYPEKFSDSQLNIPESGNGLPDILDEVHFGLEIWRHSMNPDGGVSGMLETWTHPKMDNTEVDYAFSQRTRWSSLIFAAAAAQFAEQVKPFNQEIFKIYEEAAIRAFQFGNNPENSLGKTVIQARKKRGKKEPYKFEWTETQNHIIPYLLHAKLRLFLLTGSNHYLGGVEDLVTNSHKPYSWKFTRSDFSPWIFYSLLEAAYALPDHLTNKWKKWFIEDAEKLIGFLKESPYAYTWPRRRDYWLAWGASNMVNYNRSLFIAYKLTNDEKYRDAAILNMDFMLGANPMGMSWTTGIGFVYPIDIQHEISEKDGIYDPVPGITIYGITGGPVFHKFRNHVWKSAGKKEGGIDFVSDLSQKSPPLWRRWMVHPHENVGKNEFTIQETMSATIFTAAMLLNNEWFPGDTQVGKSPREPRSLYGRWYLP